MNAISQFFVRGLAASSSSARKSSALSSEEFYENFETDFHESLVELQKEDSLQFNRTVISTLSTILIIILHES